MIPSHTHDKRTVDACQGGSLAKFEEGVAGVVSSWVVGPGRGCQEGSKRKDPVGTTERPAKGAGGINTPKRGVNRCAWRVGASCSNPLVGRFGGSRSEGCRGIAPPPPSDKRTCPPTTSRPVEGILPPSMRRMARFVPPPSPPVAFRAGVRSGGGIPNPALTHPSDNAGANPPDKGHFSVKTPLRYG